MKAAETMETQTYSADGWAKLDFTMNHGITRAGGESLMDTQSILKNSWKNICNLDFLFCLSR